MDRTVLHNAVIAHTSFSFCRSGGKGGQNVNKVNSKVHATLPVNAIAGLSEEELAAVLQKLSGRINTEQFLCLDVDDERSQDINRSIALARLESLIASAAYIRPKRKKTRPSKAAREKRLADKKLRSALKKARGKFWDE